MMIRILLVLVAAISKCYACCHRCCQCIAGHGLSSAGVCMFLSGSSRETKGDVISGRRRLLVVRFVGGFSRC